MLFRSVAKCSAYGTNAMHCTSKHRANNCSAVTIMIHKRNGIILTICEHIGAEEAVGISGGEGVGVDEPAVGKIVVPALEVVKARLAVVIITTVAQWVDVPDEGSIRSLFAVSTMHGVVAPRAVVVGGNERTGGIQKGNDITLRIEDVVVEGRGHSVLRDTANIGYLKTI